MDSVTQIALGAAMGQAVLGHKVGYRAAVWGGICATIPDLDVFVSMGSAVADFTYHRSFSHSLITLTLLSPILAWLINRYHRQYDGVQKQWFFLVWLALITHPLLDSFTIYGTQLFWPIQVAPVGLGSVFIIDPLYTLPLLIGVALALIAKQAAWGQRSNRIGILISSLYLVWGLGAQAYVTDIVEENLAGTVQQEQVLVTAGPFNTLLWRVLVMQENGYREGFYSILDPDRSISFTDYPNQTQLLNQMTDHWPVERLKWFSKGFLKVKKDLNSDLLVSDLRMGVEPSYSFTFKVAEVVKDRILPVRDQRIEIPHHPEQIENMMRRIISRNP